MSRRGNVAKTDMEIKKGQPIFKDADFFKSLKDGIYEIDIKNLDMRTVKQNSAMHKLYSMTADALNDAGYSVNFVLNKRKFDTIEKIFDWGIKKLKMIPKADLVLNKMKERILSKEELEIVWTKQSVKDLIWRPLQIHLVQKESTTKLTKPEIDKVYETYNHVLSSRYGIHIPFPNKKLWDEEKEKEV